MATYLFDIMEDEDHVDHLDGDLRATTSTEERDYLLREVHKIEDGEWGAYGTVLVKVCECCGHGERDYSHALWGSVTDHTPPGRYALEDIPSEYLRSVASDILSEVTQ